MVKMDLDLGPQQAPITKERIQEMITLRPRRMQIATEWTKPLH